MRLRHDRQDDRRTEATTRQDNHNQLTPKQKTNKLDKRLGNNIGATKERKRLEKQTNENKKPTP